MRSRPWMATALVIAVAATSGSLRADEKDGLPEMQPPLTDALLLGLVGRWTTESKGAFGPGEGKVVFEKGVGGTVLLETYENESGLPGGPAVRMHGHAVTKVSKDGKTLTRWWFDDQSDGPIVLSGAVSATGWDLVGKVRGDPRGVVAMTLRTDSTGLTVEQSFNESRVWSERYTRVPK